MASNIGRSFIPIFSEAKSYDSSIKETKAWVLTTSIEKKKQALSIALALPEGNKVLQRIFEESGDIAELNTDDGVDKLIVRLDQLHMIHGQSLLHIKGYMVSQWIVIFRNL